MVVQAGLTLERAHVLGFDLVREHTARFVSMIRGLDEPSVSLPVPGSEWTVGQVVAHVRSVYGRYTTDLRRSVSPAELTRQNAEDVERLGTDLTAAAASIEEQLTVLEPVVPHIAPDQQFPFHSGQHATMAAGWGNLLGELLAHGDDIGRAVGSTFTIPAADLEILWRFAAPMLGGWLRAEAGAIQETWKLRFSFGEVDFVVDQGRLVWGLDAFGTTWVIDIEDATQFTLTFPYRRRPVTDPVTALLATRFHDL